MLKKRKRNMLQMIGLVACVMTVGLALTGCGNQSATTDTSKKASSQTATSASSEPTLKIDAAHGTFVQSGGLISVPVILQNAGSNDSIVDSNNFILKVNGKKFHAYQFPGETNDYHLDFNSGGRFQNTVSFYVGNYLTKKELKQAKIYYQTDDGKTTEAKALGITVDHSILGTNLQSIDTLRLGDYYQKAKDYKKSIKEDKKNNPDATPRTLEDVFQDPHYDELRTWVSIPLNGPRGSNEMVVKVLNGTKSDIVLNYSDFELVDRNNNEIRVAPSYRPYSVFIPHDKYATVVIPMERTLHRSGVPYSINVRADNGSDNSFFDTKGTFHPIETITSNDIDVNTIFSLTPIEYPTQDIQWTDQKTDINGNKITAKVELKNYFNLKNRSTTYQVVAENDDGTKKSFPVQKVTPNYVMTTNKQEVKWTVKDLATAMSYQKVSLYCDGKELFRLK